MPSFKERFRPSNKHKKTKENVPTGSEDSSNTVAATFAIASPLSTSSSQVMSASRASLTTTSIPTTPTIATTTTTPTTGKTIDEHTGSAALSTYHSQFSNDPCE